MKDTLLIVGPPVMSAGPTVGRTATREQSELVELRRAVRLLKLEREALVRDLRVAIDGADDAEAEAIRLRWGIS